MSNSTVLEYPDKADVIIVGTGAAGLFAALHLPEALNIVLISKDAIENSDSYLAQGGICVLRNPEDYEAFLQDTLRAGRYENNKDAVKIMIESSQEIINDLIKCGVVFDRDGENYSYTREGAHSTNRILYHKDITGKEITEKLIKQTLSRKNISISPYSTMLDILTHDNICDGIILRAEDCSLHTIYARSVIWATGGIGGLFKHSTNFPHVTGDGFAIALQNNISLQNLNYIQIHPTALYSKSSGRSFLISESLRGEGAYLLNAKGKRFVDELLPRDVVSSAIFREMKKDKKEYVSLSLTHKNSEMIKKRFPNIYQKCLEEGYDLTKDKIPVSPAQHYIMGGVAVNSYSQTSMEHLFAVGEVSCNGVHGANRLASNSLLESLVFAKRAAQEIAKTIETKSIYTAKADLSPYQNSEELAAKYKLLIMEELKRKDRHFNDEWYRNEHKCG